MNPDHIGNSLIPHQERNGHREMRSTEEHDRLFENSKQNEVIKKIIEGKDSQEIIDEIPNLKKCFEEILCIIGCSDERVLALLKKLKESEEGKDTKTEEEVADKKVGKIGFAGQGILLFKFLEKEERKRFWEEFVKKYKKQIKEIQSHDECGAAKMIWDWLHEENDRWDEFKEENNVPNWVQNADDLGKWWSEKLAGMLTSNHRHIARKEMRTGFHDARAIYFDGTGRFNPSAIEEMPIGYTCSGPGFGLNDECLKEELKVLSGIAFGNHGFGHRFNEENKFYIFVCAKDQEQLDHLMGVAKGAVADEKFSDKIEIKGFIHKVDEPDQ